MKKIIALVLSVIIALSCSAMAFAADVDTCAVAISVENEEPTTSADLLAGVKTIVNKITEAIQANNALDLVKDIIAKLTALINGITGNNTADVLGVADELEARIKEIPVLGDIYEFLHNLITTLKQKIKDLYAGNKETVAVEETECETPATTGSSTIGIAAFATVSVAAAAAYVCTKKKVA